MPLLPLEDAAENGKEICPLLTLGRATHYTTPSFSPTDTRCPYVCPTVSDGSERFGIHGAFRGAMCDDRIERASGSKNGTAQSASASAYRSKAFGMLAVTRFLIRLGEFTGQVIDWQGTLATGH